jgi:N-acetylmuramoyl-L-alanine amidase
MAKSAKDYLIGVNGGHGKNTLGKRTPLLPSNLKGLAKAGDGTMHEWEFNHTTSKYLEAELKACGFRVLMISDTTTDTPLATRTTLANSRGVDLYLSIHANANTGKWGDWGGLETYTYPKGESLRIGSVIHKHLLKGTKLRDRGVKNGSHLWEIKKTQMPCVLVECGFMDNKEEAALLLSDAYRRECAREIAQGICEAYKVPYKGSSSIAKPSNPVTGAKPPKEGIGFIKVLVNDLWYYDKPDWKAKAGQVDKDIVFTVMQELTVDGSKMYKLKSGLYITAWYEYVKFMKEY